MIEEGDSSVPATSLPTMIQSAPAAKALAIFPEHLFPPSEIKGILNFLQTGATSITADNYGTPAPATILVIQMDPFPIPHLIPSAPALIKFKAPSPVATDPATISTSGKVFFKVFTASIQIVECPLATSTTNTLHPAATKAVALSK